MELVVVVAIIATLTGLVMTAISPDSLQVVGAAGNATAAGITTMGSMGVIRDAIFGDGVKAGYWKDMGRDPDFWPRHLQWLEMAPTAAQVYGSVTGSYSYATQMLTHSVSRRMGWRGPYLRAATMLIPATVPTALGGGVYRAPVDGWGGPILMVPPSNVLSGWDQRFSPFPADAAYNRWILSNCRLVSAGPNRVFDSITNLSDFSAHLANTNLAGDDVILWLRE